MRAYAPEHAIGTDHMLGKLHLWGHALLHRDSRGFEDFTLAEVATLPAGSSGRRAVISMFCLVKCKTQIEIDSSWLG